jgi:hypothetical protein
MKFCIEETFCMKQRLAACEIKTHDSPQGLGIFLFATASIPALVPTQPLIRWVSLGEWRPEREADR